MEYTPTPVQQPPSPNPEYVLVEDVTGQPLPKRGPQVIKVIRYEINKEGKEEKREVEIKVPFAPKSNCKKCLGRGYIGFDQKIQIIPCIRCYPPR